MNLAGYPDRIACIDLTARTVSYEPLCEADARKYIGGRGLGVKYVFDNGPRVDADSPENLLCFMVGPLTGSLAAMSGRLCVVTKSPLTGTVTDSHQGGWSGARLRWAGFDGLLFRGRAQRPTYAYVEDGRVELRDAGNVWGLGCHDTVRALSQRHGDDVSVITIGRGGERGVRFAAWANEDDRLAGRGGTGAVGGNKLLKAIVIKARKRMPAPADAGAFADARHSTMQVLAGSPATAPKKGALAQYGTLSGLAVLNILGAMPTRNAQLTSFEGAAKLQGDAIKDSILVRNPTCHACAVACKKEVETAAGEFHVHMESFEYENAWAFGPACMNDDAAAVAYISDLCNDFGMDTIEMGNALAMAMEASERGLLADPIAWGDARRMAELVRMTATREGIGDVLAEGTARAAVAFGDASMAMAVKGQAISGYDPRGMKGMGLGFATSNRGACHLRGYSPMSEMAGVPYWSKPTATEGKAALLTHMQDLAAVSDSFDLCKFSAFAETFEDYARQYNAMTGASLTAEELQRAGERIYNLERHYNNLAGFGAGSDTLPARFLTDPASGGGAKGEMCDLDAMLAEYYDARGWDDGVVRDSKLRELGVP